MASVLDFAAAMRASEAQELDCTKRELVLPDSAGPTTARASSGLSAVAEELDQTGFSTISVTRIVGGPPQFGSLLLPRAEDVVYRGKECLDDSSGSSGSSASDDDWKPHDKVQNVYHSSLEKSCGTNDAGRHSHAIPLLSLKATPVQPPVQQQQQQPPSEGQSAQALTPQKYTARGQSCYQLLTNRVHECQLCNSDLTIALRELEELERTIWRERRKNEVMCEEKVRSDASHKLDVETLEGMLEHALEKSETLEARLAQWEATGLELLPKLDGSVVAAVPLAPLTNASPPRVLVSPVSPGGQGAAVAGGRSSGASLLGKHRRPTLENLEAQEEPDMEPCLTVRGARQTC